MALPFEPPIEPMLAKAADALPSDDGWLFEPKWDGFRALVFRDGDDVYTQSRDLKPLDRYFPELTEPLKAALPERCILDGEVVIARDGALDFEALLLRIHPAASRVKMLAEESPASFVAWDLLALGDVHHLLGVNRNAVRHVKLAWPAPGLSPREEQPAISGKPVHPGIAIAIADEQVAAGRDCQCSPCRGREARHPALAFRGSRHAQSQDGSGRRCR